MQFCIELLKYVVVVFFLFILSLDSCNLFWSILCRANPLRRHDNQMHCVERSRYSQLNAMPFSKKHFLILWLAVWSCVMHFILSTSISSLSFCAKLSTAKHLAICFSLVRVSRFHLWNGKRMSTSQGRFIFHGVIQIIFFHIFSLLHLSFSSAVALRSISFSISISLLAFRYFASLFSFCCERSLGCLICRLA